MFNLFSPYLDSPSVPVPGQFHPWSRASPGLHSLGFAHPSDQTKYQCTDTINEQYMGSIDIPWPRSQRLDYTITTHSICGIMSLQLPVKECFNLSDIRITVRLTGQ
jgi:hypothetical protein